MVVLLGLTTRAGQAQYGPIVSADSMDAIVQTYADSGFTGVVLVAKGDAVLLRRAYNRGGSTLTPSSAFWIGSMTKGFTAAAVLELQRQKRLTVHDSLARFFPSVPPDKRAITIHQLLTHTAGFTDSYAAGGAFDRESAVRAILAQPLAYAPGKGYRYGNDDYALLAAVLEVVTDREWRDVVRQSVLRPVGLKHTGFWCGPWVKLPRPVPTADGAHETCDPRRPVDWGHRGATGISSTVDDLRQWTRALDAIRFAAIGDPQLLVRREESLDVSYGYGVRVYSRDGRVIERMHSGSADDGHTSIVRRLSSGLIVIVLSNAGQHANTTWSSYVATRLVPRTL
jgi:CubicO group peptidase (beta-lactamase class C family)